MHRAVHAHGLHHVVSFAALRQQPVGLGVGHVAGDEHVVARTTDQGVVAPASVEHIVAFVAVQHVVAQTAQQGVVASAAVQQVVAGLAVDHVGARVAQQTVGLLAAAQVFNAAHIQPAFFVAPGVAQGGAVGARVVAVSTAPGQVDVDPGFFRAAGADVAVSTAVERFRGREVQPVVAGTTVDLHGAIDAQGLYHVVAFAALRHDALRFSIGHVAGDQHVVARPTDQGVGATAAVEHIVGAVAGDDVVAAVARAVDGGRTGQGQVLARVLQHMADRAVDRVGAAVRQALDARRACIRRRCWYGWAVADLGLGGRHGRAMAHLGLRLAHRQRRDGWRGLVQRGQIGDHAGHRSVGAQLARQGGCGGGV